MSLLLLDTSPPPVVVPPPPVFVSAFELAVARMDRVAQALLGGEPIIYQPEASDPVTVVGIFDELYVRQADAMSGVEALGPAVFLRLEDLPVDPEEDEPTLLIRNRTYRPIERRPDGMGGIMLELRLVVT